MMLGWRNYCLHAISDDVVLMAAAEGPHQEGINQIEKKMRQFY